MTNIIRIAGDKGYGSAGASTRKRATKGFRAMSGSPQEDIDYNNYTLRQRGRLMYMGSPIATSAIKTNRTNTIGLGLKLNPRPDVEFLNMTDEAAAEWVKTVKREFGLWADKKNACDATGINDFYEIQQMLMLSWLTSGDVFVLIQSKAPTKNNPYGLRLRAIEADRVATPTELGITNVYGVTTGKNKQNGNTIYDGVEIDDAGEAVAYWIRNTYPYEVTDKNTKFERIEAVGSLTGLPNIIHIIATERPDQYRGVTFLAPVILQLLQLNRYTEAELTAAVISSFFTAFIKTESETYENPFNEVGSPADTEEASYDPNEYEMGPGQINVMNPGESVEFADPKHPSSGFDTFVNAMATQIGASLEIPKDILLKSFNASYSASRGALLEAWKSFNMYRTWFINDFCNPVYELWMTEAVALGRIKAPGFFNDPAVKAAWLGNQWIGPSQGQLDPTKEIEAERMACENGFSTRADSARRLNGSDFDSNVDQLAREMKHMEAITGQQDKENAPAPAEPQEPEEPEKTD
jgi:lambda family phage portal protein